MLPEIDNARALRQRSLADSGGGWCSVTGMGGGGGSIVVDEGVVPGALPYGPRFCSVSGASCASAAVAKVTQAKNTKRRIPRSYQE
jgi:hypothetical protein